MKLKYLVQTINPKTLEYILIDKSRGLILKHRKRIFKYIPLLSK